MSERSGGLDTPGTRRRPMLNLDSDVVGEYSERVARFLGTGRYLAAQTVIVVVWIALNMLALSIQWDPYPFILLNLAFSTQAAYAAPLILLAQNRQENRDKISIEEDRLRAAQTKADTEFLARELAAVRLAVGESVTRDYLRKELDDLLDELTDRMRAAQALREAIDGEETGEPKAAKRKQSKSKRRKQQSAPESSQTPTEQPADTDGRPHRPPT